MNTLDTQQKYLNSRDLDIPIIGIVKGIGGERGGKGEAIEEG